jgi:hypothetical protein
VKILGTEVKVRLGSVAQEIASEIRLKLIKKIITITLLTHYVVLERQVIKKYVLRVRAALS